MGITSWFKASLPPYHNFPHISYSALLPDPSPTLVETPHPDTIAARTEGLTDPSAMEVLPRWSSMQDNPAGRDKKAATFADVSGAKSDVSILDDFEGEAPTQEELQTLRKIADKLPWSAYLVAFVELCERFAYYGISGPFQNYIQNPYNDGTGVPGAIGLGQTGATGLSNFFQFWCYLTPVLGAIVADQYLGKYNTILYFAMIYITGLIILFATALPVSIEHGASLPGLIVAMIVIGLGTGGIKSNVSPLIAEQYTQTRPTIKTLTSGERVILDPAVTIQRIYMIFYLCINLGSLSAIATTEMELNIGFWSAYLLPLCMFVVGLVAIVVGKKYYVVRPPSGSVIVHAFKAMWIGACHNFNMDAAKPSYRNVSTTTASTPWSDQFIDELKRALTACKVFLFFPVFWLVYGQMINNFVSQAGQMELHGIPNDIMQNIDSLTIVVFIPICDRVLYPALRKVGIPFRPITRITWGFGLAALSMTYAAVVQHLIYTAPPCYDAPLACDASDNGTIPNKIHVAVQTPAYLFIGLSEIFASITGLEYAFTKAPPSMKSFIMSIFLFQSAIGAAFGIALSPAAKDPRLVGMFTGLAVAMAVCGVLFWVLFRHLNASEDSMNAIEDQGLKPVLAAEISAMGYDQCAAHEAEEGE